MSGKIGGKINRTISTHARRSSKGRTILAALLAMLAGSALISNLFAHGGDDHGAAAAQGATPISTGSMVTITKEQQFALEMLTEPAAMHELAQGVEATGRVVPRTEGVAEVITPVGGEVSGGRLPRLGERVRKGEVLFRVQQVLSPSERTSLRTEQIRTKAELDAVQQELSRLERLEGVVAGKQIVEARIRRDAARDAYAAISAQLSGRGGSVAVTAPISGVITEAEIAGGEVLDESRVVYRIADLSRVWVEADLFEGSIASVEGAQRAEIRTSSYPGEVFSGTLYQLGSTIDPAARTIRTLFLVDNPGERLKLNMSATIAVNVASRGSVLAVPRDAVVRNGARSVVFVHADPEHFEVRDVVPGSGAAGSYIEILSGLKAGERVLVKGMHQVRGLAGM